MKVAILTAGELRHEFFRKALNSFREFEVCCCIYESSKEDQFASAHVGKNLTTVEALHFEQRRQTEIDFFDLYVMSQPEPEHTLKVGKNAINMDRTLQDTLIASAPDIVVSYGCSIIREPLISCYPGRFVNLHLGLSPYYRGSGTNFWPLVNREPEHVGVTFMQIDRGVDTGPILHQLRPEIFAFDSVHTIGNRLIKAMAFELREVLIKLFEIKPIPQWKVFNERVYRKKDFNQDAVDQMNENFASGMLVQYLHKKAEFDSRSPIVRWGSLS